MIVTRDRKLSDGKTESTTVVVRNTTQGSSRVAGDLTIQQNLSVLTILISEDEGLTVQNAFLEPDIGSCVPVSDGGPFPLNDESVRF